MHISATQSWIWQQDLQNHSLFDDMEMVLITVVEADDHENHRSVNYFSTFFIKKTKQIRKKKHTFCRLQIQTSFSNG